MGKTSIEWTNVTWNPVRGCSRVSEGCRNCYAERQAFRFINKREGQKIILNHGPFAGFVTKVNGHPAWTGKVELVEKHLEDPLRWREPRRVFVNSMSDLFHEALPDEVIDRVFAVMALGTHHTYQVLTKRPERALDYMLRKRDIRETVRGILSKVRLPRIQLEIADERLRREYLPNVWLGVSVEDQATADERIPLLLQTSAAVRFVSYEPALGPVDFNDSRDWLTANAVHRTSAMDGRLDEIDWIIVGGESGPGARPFDIQWARNAIEQCKAAGVACFVKQVGSAPIFTWDPEQDAVPGGRLRDRKGGDMAEWPEDLRVREFPNA